MPYKPVFLAIGTARSIFPLRWAVVEGAPMLRTFLPNTGFAATLKNPELPMPPDLEYQPEG
jgi:hypothetical protein